MQLRIEKQTIITVAMFGETPILMKPLATNFTNGLKIYLNRYFDGNFHIYND